MNAGRYAGLDSTARRVIREMIRDAVTRPYANPDKLAQCYAELFARSFMGRGGADLFWLRCYELCDRLAAVQMHARNRARQS